MKSLYYTLGVASVGLLTASAQSNVFINVQSSAAQACYESARAKASASSAVEQCTGALQNDRLPTDERVATFVNRGIVLMLANRTDEAIRDFDTAMAIDATEPEAYLNKGVTKFRLGDSAEAYNLASRALELRTRKPALAFYVRGLANEERGNVKAAYADLKRAQVLDPTWTEPTAQLARYRVK